MDDSYRVSVSMRVWLALGVLVALLIYTSISMFLARSELNEAKASLAAAEAKVKENDLMLKNALADKEQVMKELAVQGSLIAQSSRGEEKARSELATLTESAEEAQQRAAALAKQVKSLKAQLATARKRNAAVAGIREDSENMKTAIADLRARLQSALTEIERLRPLAEPYGQTSPPVAPLPLPAEPVPAAPPQQ